MGRLIGRLSAPQPARQPARPAGPFLKWAGGKGQLVADILARMPAKVDTYFEPFVGDGALFFALANEGRFERAVIADRNRALVEVFVAIQRDVETVIKELGKLRTKNNPEDYYLIRGSSPSSLAARAARVIFLNKTCFNGLWRVNSKGAFNVPFGNNPKATTCDAAGLRAASFALKRTTVVEDDFERVARWARPGDGVYFDPPYYPVSKTAYFTSYDRDGFGPDEQQRLARVMAELGERGVFALLSNSDCPATRLLYERFDAQVVMVSRAINSVTSRRGKVSELLVLNGAR